MTILRSTFHGAIRAAPFAVAFLALRRSNRQHVRRDLMLRDAVRELAGRAETIGRVAASTSGELCAVQDRLDGIARAAAAA